MQKLWLNIVNYVLFQIGWIAAIYLQSGFSAIFCFSIGLLNCWLLSRKYTLLLCVALISLLGIANDWCLIHYGVISIKANNGLGIPYWLLGLWFVFVSTFAGCLSWMRTISLVYLAALGAFGGAISYCIASELGAFTYNWSRIPEFLFFAINWAVLFPIAFRLFWKLVPR